MNYLDYEGAIEELKQIETYKEYDNWYYIYQDILNDEQIPESEWNKETMLAEHLHNLELLLKESLDKYGE